MIWRLFSLALFGFVCAPSLLHAQSFQVVDLYRGISATIDSTNYDKMYEDIEIFRRILDRQLQPLYPSHTYHTLSAGDRGSMGGMPPGMGGMRGMPPGMGGMPPGMSAEVRLEAGTVVIPIRSLEGVYLKGEGVVYTATLTSLQPPAKTAKAEAAKPVSEWDSVRRQIRNEKEEPKKAEAAKPPTLSDVLLKMLVENGHHFSQLEEYKYLTIVITVHPADTSSSSRKSKGGGGSGGSPKKASSKPKSDGGSDYPGKDLALLGVLHMNQGRHEEAIESFLKVLELQPDLNARRKAAPGLFRKLAQCYLALGQDEKAQKMLDEIRSLLKEPADAGDKPATTDKPAAALPVKLIVSAPKKLLQQAKEGKINFEEFRRQARVEIVGGANSTR